MENFLQSSTQRPAGSADAAYDKYLTDLVRQLRKTPGSKLNVEAILTTLDPTQNSLQYLFALLAHQQHVTNKALTDEVVFAIAGYLTSFGPVPVRYAGQEWRQLISWTAEIVHTTGDAQLLQALRSALLRMDSTTATFTSNHLLFLQLCLGLQMPRQALPILDNDIYCLPSNPTKGIDEQLPCAEHELSCNYITISSGISEKLAVTDVQEYYLLGAFVYIGIRDYERASLFLELVLSVPTSNNAVNQYMVEAYKKLLVVGLLAQGKPYNTGHLVDQAALRTIQSLSKPYDALVTAFRNRDLQKYHAEYEVADDLWKTDGNDGIVQQAAEALRRYRVIDLHKTYSSLPVERVAIHLSLSTDATLQLLRAMISDGHLSANISQRSASDSTSILRFQPQASLSSTDVVDTAIQSQITKIDALSTFVKEADRRLLTTKEYADYTRRNKKIDGAPAGSEDPMEMSWDGPNGGDDEDIMAA